VLPFRLDSYEELDKAKALIGDRLKAYVLEHGFRMLASSSKATTNSTRRQEYVGFQNATARSLACSSVRIFPKTS
jgi:hypothetical protein